MWRSLLIYDKKVIEVFLKNQGKLFDEPVADSLEEADEFLDDCCAVVADTKKEALKYMRENLDCGGMSEAQILDSDEVFEVGDGRYLIVEG